MIEKIKNLKKQIKNLKEKIKTMSEKIKNRLNVQKKLIKLFLLLIFINKFLFIVITYSCYTIVVGPIIYIGFFIILFMYIYILLIFIHKKNYFKYILYFLNFLSFIILILLIQLYSYKNINLETLIYFNKDFLCIIQKWDNQFLMEYTINRAKKLQFCVEDLDLNKFIVEYNTPEIINDQLLILKKQEDELSFIYKSYRYFTKLPAVYQDVASFLVSSVCGFSISLLLNAFTFYCYDINIIDFALTVLCCNNDTVLFNLIPKPHIPNEFLYLLRENPCIINKPDMQMTATLHFHAANAFSHTIHSEFVEIEEKTSILSKAFQSVKIMQECSELSDNLVRFCEDCIQSNVKRTGFLRSIVEFSRQPYSFTGDYDGRVLNSYLRVFGQFRNFITYDELKEHGGDLWPIYSKYLLKDTSGITYVCSHLNPCR